jgi:hypothetical protein
MPRRYRYLLFLDRHLERYKKKHIQNAKMKQYAPWLLTGGLAVVCIILFFRKPDVLPAEIKAKDAVILAGQKKVDSLTKRLAIYEKGADAPKQAAATAAVAKQNDSLKAALSKSHQNTYALAHEVLNWKKVAVEARDNATDVRDSTCEELAHKVLLDSAAFEVIAKSEDKERQGYQTLIGIKDSITTQLRAINAQQAQVISDQQNKAALQSAELKKQKKTSLKQKIGLVALGVLAGVGWVLAAH